MADLDGELPLIANKIFVLRNFDQIAPAPLFKHRREIRMETLSNPVIIRAFQNEKVSSVRRQREPAKDQSDR